MIAGLGIRGYALALHAMAEMLEAAGEGRRRMTRIPFDPDAIRMLAAVLTETGLTEIEIAEKDSRIRVVRGGADGGARRGGISVRRACAGRRLSRRAGLGRGGTRGASRRGDQPDGRRRLSAARTGRAAVRYASGQAVTAGQTLLLIEAMKTFNQIKAPKAGTVARVLVANGAPVEYGEVLMILEPERSHLVPEDPHCQPRRDRASHPARLPRTGHSDRRGALHRRRRGHACPAGGGECLHRPAAGEGQLSQHSRHPVGRQHHRRGRDPSRLRVPGGERPFRRHGGGARADLHRPVGGAYRHDGRQDRGQGGDGVAGRAAGAGLGRRGARSRDGARGSRARSAIRC